MEFIENVGDTVVKGKSPANIKGISPGNIKGKSTANIQRKMGKVPTKGELKDCSTSPDMFSSDQHKAHLDGM